MASASRADRSPRILVDVVPELVRDDELGLVVGECLDERIAEHDPMRAADAGDEGVRLARLAGSCPSQNLGVADAEAARERAQALFERSVTGSKC